MYVLYVCGYVCTRGSRSIGTSVGRYVDRRARPSSTYPQLPFHPPPPPPPPPPPQNQQKHVDALGPRPLHGVAAQAAVHAGAGGREPLRPRLRLPLQEVGDFFFVGGFCLIGCLLAWFVCLVVRICVCVCVGFEGACVWMGRQARHVAQQLTPPPPPPPQLTPLPPPPPPQQTNKQPLLPRRVLPAAPAGHARAGGGVAAGTGQLHPGGWVWGWMGGVGGGLGPPDACTSFHTYMHACRRPTD